VALVITAQASWAQTAGQPHADARATETISSLDPPDPRKDKELLPMDLKRPWIGTPLRGIGPDRPPLSIIQPDRSRATKAPSTPSA
jgi:hypothetical protein